MDLKRPMSWSSKSSFDYDPEQWYQKYVMHGKCTRDGIDASGVPYFGWCHVTESHNHKCPQIETSYQMTFGKLVGEKLAADPKFMPHIPRLSEFEFPLECKLGKISLVGYIDSYEPHTDLEEYKTGVKPWDQKRADTHGQVDFYLLCLWLMYKIRPEDIKCHIRWMPTQQNGDFSISFVDEKDVRTFATKRTMRDILQFGSSINGTFLAMQAYAATHP